MLGVDDRNRVIIAIADADVSIVCNGDGHRKVPNTDCLGGEWGWIGDVKKGDAIPSHIAYIRNMASFCVQLWFFETKNCGGEGEKQHARMCSHKPFPLLVYTAPTLFGIFRQRAIMSGNA
jgi:hypothetical protein